MINFDYKCYSSGNLIWISEKGSYSWPMVYWSDLTHRGLRDDGVLVQSESIDQPDHLWDPCVVLSKTGCADMDHTEIFDLLFDNHKEDRAVRRAKACTKLVIKAIGMEWTEVDSWSK